MLIFVFEIRRHNAVAYDDGPVHGFEMSNPTNELRRVKFICKQTSGSVPHADAIFSKG